MSSTKNKIDHTIIIKDQHYLSYTLLVKKLITTCSKTWFKAFNCLIYLFIFEITALTLLNLFVYFPQCFLYFIF